MDKANSRLLVARLKHREVIRVSEKTEDLQFPRCWWADNLTIDHEVPFVCSRVAVPVLPSDHQMEEVGV